MYLHSDRETFKNLIEQAAADSGRTPAVIEKDYYVTLIRLSQVTSRPILSLMRKR